MSELMTLRDFFRQYFLTFMGGVFAACFSLALAVALAFITYFRDAPMAQVGLKIMSAGALLILLTVHSNFMIFAGPTLLGVGNGRYLCRLSTVCSSDGSIPASQSPVWVGAVIPIVRIIDT